MERKIGYKLKRGIEYKRPFARHFLGFAEHRRRLQFRGTFLHGMIDMRAFLVVLVVERRFLIDRRGV